MLFDKKERAGRKHLVFYDMVLYNNEVFQTGREIKHGKTPVLRDARLDKTVFGGMAAVEKEKCAMAKPVLVIMAAGMGSRYGGLKQIDPVGPNGQIILDYSIYDAHRAGFERVVFIIRPELHEAFEQAIGGKARRFMQVDYAYQTLDKLPEGLHAPEGREKPLGTAHAVWCASELTAGAPIAVINADDFYGADAFRKMYDFLSVAQDDEKYRYCMVGYQVENTLTENGTVSRGVCTVDENGLLTALSSAPRFRARRTVGSFMRLTVTHQRGDPGGYAGFAQPVGLYAVVPPDAGARSAPLFRGKTAAEPDEG